MARAEVMALVAGSPMSPRPPFASAATPLRVLPAELETKLAARAQTGIVAGDGKDPHGRVWRRVVVPSAGLATIDAGGVVVAAASGHYVLAAIAGALFVPLAAVAALGARFAAHDPLRLTASDQRAIHDASRWESVQAWASPLATSSERGLVIAATRAAERIARSVTWRSGRIDEQRVRLDLGAELDQIDDQAYRIASARTEHGTTSMGTAPVVDAAWEATLNRVAALTAYADHLDGYDKQRSEALARQGDPVRDSDLMAGSVRDELALDDLVALTFYLSANRHDPPG
jgi:hypothetical protein